jgi:pimeloyl-ACP methyl ester carboxylesterase
MYRSGMVSQPVPLAPALSGERRELQGAAGRLSYYVAGPDDGSRGRPLLLVHSVNAAASAYEVRPLFEHYRRTRPVYALDLPGFGFSDRSDRPYTPRLMSDAVLAMVEAIRGAHGGGALDALALSLSCEFAARAAVEAPGGFASLALVSPTGFNGERPRRGAAGSNRGMPALYRLFTLPLWDRAFFALLTSRPSIGYFLRKTFGSDRVDPGLLDYAHATSHQPGARHAPYCFVTGFLFSGDVFTLYEALRMPVWMAHGVRGDFQDYRLARLLAERENWTVEVFQTGALPHFELPAAVIASYDAFIGGLPRPAA